MREKYDANPWLDFGLGFALGLLGLAIMLLRMRSTNLRWELFGAGVLVNVWVIIVFGL